MVMLDDTRCGLDASSLHRATSMVNYNAKKFGLLSCNRDTSSTSREKAKQKLRNHLPSFLFINPCAEKYYFFKKDINSIKFKKYEINIS